MDSNRTSLLTNTDDRVFNVASSHHHQVGQLVDDDQNVRQAGEATRLAIGTELARLGLDLAIVECLVITADIAESAFFEEFIAALHLTNCPCQRVRCLLRVGNGLGKQVRDPLVLRHLHALWIDQDHANVVGGVPHE